MNQAIRKRIEDINNGIVPEGYKQTPFGIFPCDWETISLGDLLDFKNGVNADKEKYNSGVKMISVMDILADGPIYYDKIRGQVDIDENTLNTYSVTYGDILFQRSSETFEDAGKSNVYLDCDKTATYSGFVIRGKKKAEYNPYFLNESLKISQVRKQIIRNAAGSQHINVGQESLEKIIVPSALSAEQGKIAEILMKWDEMVELQEQYIQKLELRKKAIMKKLLTPKGGWQKCKLKEFIKIKSGYAFKSETYVENGLYKILTIKNVQKGYLDYSEISTIDKLPLNLQKHQILQIDDIIISLTGNVGRSCYITKENCLLNQRVGKVECLDENKLFIYAILQTDGFISSMVNIAQGGAQANLSNEDIENFEFFTPFINGGYDKEAHYKIGKLNFAIDEEISLQKEKLDRIKIQRKAMQQYLLTGIVRVG